MLFWLYTVVITCGYTLGTTIAPNIGHQNADLNLLVHQLINRTAILEANLAAEVRMRENLEAEVQSKNDLTQFLRADVLRLNGTVFQELARRQSLESSLATLTNRVDNLESSMTENSEIQAGLKSSIHRINVSLSTNLASLQNRVHDMNTSLVTLQTSCDSDMTSLNATVIRNTNNIMNAVSNITSIHGEMNDLWIKFSNVNSSLILVKYDLGQVEQSTVSLNNSMASSKQTLANLQQAIHNDVHQLNATLASQRSGQNVENVKFHSQVNSLNNSLTQQTSTLNYQTASLHHSVSELLTKVTDNGAAIQSVKSSVQSLGSPTPKPSTSTSHGAMFSASRLRSPLTPVPIFEKVITNVGAAFDPRHSLFTCPTTGYYLFTVSLQMADTNTSPAQCWLRRNGSLVMSIFAQALFPGTSASASNTVILQLVKGDRVDLSRCSGGPDLLPDSSTFSGALISVS